MGTFLTIALTLAFVVLPMIFGKKDNGYPTTDVPKKRPLYEEETDDFEENFENNEEKNTYEEQFLYNEYNASGVAEQPKQNIGIKEEATKAPEENKEGSFNLKDAVVYSVILQNPYIEQY